MDSGANAGERWRVWVFIKFQVPGSKFQVENKQLGSVPLTWNLELGTSNTPKE
jgi:hypothetical protein